ncbi:MAG: AAA family ATPase [Microthrixaceae bacterium]|nr:AAA family ATPase [Microthrixaceae bacterium]
MAAEAPSANLSPAVAETHSGVVFFYGECAYKLKKPLDLGFLDFRSRETRRAVCHREVELNRRLAPDVYLGVADVLDSSGELCEHMVVMRRMPDDRRLSKLVAAGVDVRSQLDALARLLVGFHATAARGPRIDTAAGVDAVARRWAANTAELQRFAGRFVPADAIATVDALAARYLEGRRGLFEGRVAEGRACDGHGDLLADDIFCLDDGPRVLDCLEFDDDLRFGDVLADVAFLAMDLERLGRGDLAEEFLASYRDEARDSWPASLAHHHIAYRAQVRAKVAAIRAAQQAESGAVGEGHAAEQAVALLDLARRHLEEGRVRLIVVGGLPGTGKSTLAAGLGQALGAVVLRSDVLRKELAGLEPERGAAAAFGEGIYSADSTAATYRELLTRAQTLLGLGQTAVLDASWTDATQRNAARTTASAAAADLVELCCVSPVPVTVERIRQRAQRGDDASDADEQVASALAQIADPWPEATRIDTDAEPSKVLHAAMRAIGSPTQGARR